MSAANTPFRIVTVTTPLVSEPSFAAASVNEEVVEPETIEATILVAFT